MPSGHVAEGRFSAAAAVGLPASVREAEANLGNEAMLVAKRNQLQVKRKERIDE